VARLKNSRLFGFSILLGYILVTFVFIHPLESLGAYAQTIFESLFTILVICLYRDHLKLKSSFNRRLLIQFIVALFFGFGIYRFAGYLHIGIPFDFTSHETILFLLLIGPILEEFLFRQALWSAMQVMADNRLVAFIGTSALFVFGHFFSYFFLPKEYQPFILYQTAYVSIIALWWGFNILKRGVITTTVILHIAFNFGFYMGFRLI